MAKVALLGFGVVGSGVAEVLKENRETIARRVGEEVELKYILVRRDFPGSPFGPLMVRDFGEIETDRSVDVVVEAMGGVEAALDYTRRALTAGKSVVTANKELVATHGQELMELAFRHGCGYYYEASVGGGVPIIRPLRQCLTADRVTGVWGILNGTTNYILTRMIRGGLSFDAALAEAQEKGYAEADPTADIEGIDTCRKVCILASLAFGRHIFPHQVPTRGITGVTLTDVACARKAGCQIKLLGRTLGGEDGRVRAFVEPHLVREEAPLAGVEDVFNAITVRGNMVGEVLFYGRGAGKLPTASAVVGDVVEALSRRGGGKAPDWQKGGESATVGSDGVADRWYVRLAGGKAPEAFPGAQVLSRAEGMVAFLTGEALTAEELERRLAGETPLSAFRMLEG